MTRYEKALWLALVAIWYFLLALPPAHAQSNEACQKQACMHLYFYDGSSNLTYICEALQRQATATTVTKAATTLINIVVSTNVATVTTSSAHKLYPGARVTVTGATVDTDLNASYVVLTVGSTTTYTFATVAVADATYTDAGLVISTNNPLTSASVWAIQIQTYISTTMAGQYMAGASRGFGLSCDSRTSY